jgi:hypothetical protein
LIPFEAFNLFHRGERAEIRPWARPGRTEQA